MIQSSTPSDCARTNTCSTSPRRSRWHRGSLIQLPRSSWSAPFPNHHPAQWQARGWSEMIIKEEMRRKFWREEIQSRRDEGRESSNQRGQIRRGNRRGGGQTSVRARRIGNQTATEGAAGAERRVKRPAWRRHPLARQGTRGRSNGIGGCGQAVEVGEKLFLLLLLAAAEFGDGDLSIRFPSLAPQAKTKAKAISRFDSIRFGGRGGRTLNWRGFRGFRLKWTNEEKIGRGTR